MSAILYQFSDGVARITLNRPDKLNSLNEAMHGELRQAIGRVQTDGARSLILTGAGRAFCTGQDLSERVTPPGAPPPDLGLSIETHYKPLVLALRALPFLSLPQSTALRPAPAPIWRWPAISSWRHSRQSSSRPSAGLAWRRTAAAATFCRGWPAPRAPSALR